MLTRSPLAVALFAVWLIVGCQGSQATPAAAPITPSSIEPSPTAGPTATPATGAGDADVRFVRAVQVGDGSWSFHVTISHPDTGWEDYADGWDVVTPDGTVIKRQPDDLFTRLLLHPHVDEQPFTRSQSNLAIPAGVDEVTVRAHDLVDGFGGREVIVDLTQPEGDGFEVEKP